MSRESVELSVRRQMLSSLSHFSLSSYILFKRMYLPGINPPSPAKLPFEQSLGACTSQISTGPNSLVLDVDLVLVGDDIFGQIMTSILNLMPYGMRSKACPKQTAKLHGSVIAWVEKDTFPNRSSFIPGVKFTPAD